MLSVIVPIYNSASTLEKCIRSLTDQTYTDLQIILIDDGSNDGSAEICDTLASRDHRITVLHKENEGASIARNRGMKIATGEWLTFLDSDDTIEKDMYEYMLSSAAIDADIIQCAVNIVDGESKTVLCSPQRDKLYSSSSLGKEFFKHLGGGVWNKIYKRSLIEGLEFDSQYPIGEDMKFNIEAISRAKNILLLKKAKYNYVQNPNGLCHTITEASLLSYRKMLSELLSSRALPRAKGLLTALYLENNADMMSKLLTRSIDEPAGLIYTLRKEVRNGAAKYLFSPYISIKMKLKLTLIGFSFGLYKRILLKKKRA